MTTPPEHLPVRAQSPEANPAVEHGDVPPGLTSRAQHYAAAAHAAATRTAYTGDWRHFTDWCEQHNLAPLPADPRTVAGYLADHAGRLATGTLSRRRTVIRIAHRAAGYPSPTDHVDVRDVWLGIRRTHGTGQRAKTALWTADVARMIAGLPTNGAVTDPGVLLAVRDRALLLLVYTGALRRSELAALDVDDLTDDPHGLVLTIRSSKTDQLGAGDQVGIVRAERPELCPVTAVYAWLDALTAALGVQTLQGALFRPVDRHGRVGAPRAGHGPASRLSPAAVRLIVKKRCAAAGLDPDKYAAHSLRSGFATQASANGAAERDVMRHGRWKSVTVARRYVQRGNLFNDNAGSRLGL